MFEINHTADHSYAMGRFTRAVETLQKHPDPKVRARARKKIDQWTAVISGMASGNLTVGSRTPVKNTPPWVTLEVAHGGFATGRYMAEGPLEEDEHKILATLPSDVPGSTDRERLNLMFLSDRGQDVLLDVLETGRYRVEVPEHGALLVATWLISRGFEEQAMELVGALRPLMHRLRFYPRFEKDPMPSGSVVRVASVQEISEPLRTAKPNERVLTMNTALCVWLPLYDRLVELWLSTVDGETPNLDAQRRVVGGWPCKRWPKDWSKKRKAWLADYAKALKTHGRQGKHQNPKSNFCRLQEALHSCPKDSRALSGQQVGWIRRALANTVAKNGAPGSSQRASLRAAQAEQGAMPTHAQLARLVAQRLASYDPKGGVPSLEPVAMTVQGSEVRFAPEGSAIPQHIVDKVARALEAPIQELIERGVIGSAEVLATVLPQITAQVASAGIEEVSLRALYGRIYAAFRRRRSLLLLNLSHQVQLEELPWIAALSPLRKDGLSTRAQAKQTLQEATQMSLSAFPQTILPNPLVRELGALSKRGALEMPLVEEVAADIFMGTFTEKWQKAARQTAQVMAGTLYARYYDLPAAAELDRGAVKKRWGKRTAEDFAQLCKRRAAEAGQGRGSWVAQNGAILEQSQILTTHNLAPLVETLGLTPQLSHLAPSLVEETFNWILRRHSQPIEGFRAQLQMLKNTAYAWRQAIFFMSFVPHDVQAELLEKLEAKTWEATLRYRAGFVSAVAGLRFVFEGGRFNERGQLRSGRRFLGWSVGPHWMTA